MRNLNWSPTYIENSRQYTIPNCLCVRCAQERRRLNKNTGKGRYNKHRAEVVPTISPAEGTITLIWTHTHNRRSNTISYLAWKESCASYDWSKSYHVLQVIVEVYEPHTGAQIVIEVANWVSKDFALGQCVTPRPNYLIFVFIFSQKHFVVRVLVFVVHYNN